MDKIKPSVTSFGSSILAKRLAQRPVAQPKEEKENKPKSPLIETR